MIDRSNETLLLLADVPKQLEMITGRRISISTVHRWIREGLCGVHLECIFVGGQRMTTIEALERFDEGVTQSRIRVQEPGHQPASKRQVNRATSAARKRLGL